MLLRMHVRYYDEARDEDIVTIGNGEGMVATRDLRGKGWTDDEVTTYKAWLAAKRMHIAGAADVTFEVWSAAVVSEIEPVYTARMIDQALALGNINEKEAEVLRAEVLPDAEGESPAPRT
jgi:hypothetical protein